MIFSALLLVICALTAHASVTGYISSNDEPRLLQSLTKAFIKPADNDVISAYYGIKGFKLLNHPVVKVLKMDTCVHLEAAFKKDSPPEAAFHALAAFSLLECTGKLHTDVTVTTLKAALDSDKSSTADIRYAIEALQVLGQQIPNPTKIAQLVQAKLKEDDSLPNLGHALHAAALLGPNGKFMTDRVEDIIVQADEVDGKMLQWEGGLTVTGLLLTGLIKLPGAKSLTQVQADKFANYLLTRRSVQNAKGIVTLLESCNALANSAVSPISISIVGPPYVTTDKSDLVVTVTDILGKQLKTLPTPVVAQSATRVKDDVVVLSKQAMKPGSKPTEFILPLKLEPGQYRVSLTAGNHAATMGVKVLGPINLQTLEVGVGDADGSSAPKYNKLSHPNKVPQTLHADSTQHLFVRFTLPRTVHQAFLRLHTKNKREIIFVGEKDNSNAYKIEVNLASELQFSDTFEMELILGDSIMSNPLRWALGSIDVKLGTQETPKTTRGPKPEIKHLFRPAEKRPPQVVSLLFTALTAAPLLLLLILWLKIGINFGNFTITALPFHLGLGSILGLYTLFWLKLDMFVTCTWLIPIGGFTFLAGNRLLRKIAKQKKH